MRIVWTDKASGDLARLHDFLASVAPDAAVRTTQRLRAAPRRLVEFPRLGERIDAYDPREVRRILVGNYEIRYEIADPTIIVLRLWHMREYREVDA